MSNLINFDFNSHPVRVVNNDPINPLFVASDVATALGYSKPENAIARHCKDKTTTPKQGGGFLSVIREPDLYRLIFGSKLKSAVQFQDWVFDEVLPAIRKTGKYEKPDPRARFLSEEQAGHIYQIVMKLAGSGHYTYQGLFGALKKQFRASSYKNILKVDYPQACHFLGAQPLKELMEQTDNTPIRELGSQGSVTPMDGRYLVVIEKGRVSHMQSIRGKSVVDTEGYRRLSKNLSTIKQQLRWLEGEENINILDKPVH